MLKQLNRQNITAGFPRLIAAGRTPFYKYIIMELVGPDLQLLRRSIPEKKLMRTLIHIQKNHLLFFDKS